MRLITDSVRYKEEDGLIASLTFSKVGFGLSGEAIPETDQAPPPPLLIIITNRYIKVNYRPNATPIIIYYY